MICPKCKEEKRTSTVTDEMVDCGSWRKIERFSDEKGNQHTHDSIGGSVVLSRR